MEIDLHDTVSSVFLSLRERKFERIHNDEQLQPGHTQLPLAEREDYSGKISYRIYYKGTWLQCFYAPNN